MEPLAVKKFENFSEYVDLYPEYQCIFVGDNGQGDVRCAEMVMDSSEYSGSNLKAASWIDSFYSSIIKAGTYKTSSIKVAEAAKVIENTQRDLNIALINELAFIFNKLGISTFEVLKAACTKWNFLDFKPGLVGGHCIGVDPYYLSYKSLKSGYKPNMILSGRKINDDFPIYISKTILEICSL